MSEQNSLKTQKNQDGGKTVRRSPKMKTKVHSLQDKMITMVIKSVGSGSRKKEFESRLYYLLAGNLDKLLNFPVTL